MYNINIKIFLTNLGKYNEGEFVLDCGKWFELPLDDDELKDALKSIGVEDNTEYEEYFITDYEYEVCAGYDMGDNIRIGEYESISKLSELCESLNELDENEFKLLSALLETTFVSDIYEAVNCIRPRKYDLIECESKSEYARDYVENCFSIPGNLIDYIDFEKLGEDLFCNEIEMTSLGCVRLL